MTEIMKSLVLTAETVNYLAGRALDAEAKLEASESLTRLYHTEVVASREEVQSLRYQLTQAKAEGWRDIATAPWNTYVIVAGRSGYTTTPLRAEVCKWDADCECWRDYSHQRFTDSGEEATLWMPLPAQEVK